MIYKIKYLHGVSKFMCQEDKFEINYISKLWDGDLSCIVYTENAKYAKRFWSWTANKIIKKLRENEEQGLREFHCGDYEEVPWKFGLTATTSDHKFSIRGKWERIK